MGAGGALFVLFGDATIKNTVFNNNGATGGNGGQAGTALGGAIFNLHGTVSATDSQFNGNFAATNPNQIKGPSIAPTGTAVYAMSWLTPNRWTYAPATSTVSLVRCTLPPTTPPALATDQVAVITNQ
jgi:hypothetical protein